MNIFPKKKKGLAIKFMTVVILGLIITLVLLVAMGPAKGILIKLKNMLSSGFTYNKETTASALALRCAINSVGAGKIDYDTCVSGVSSLNLLTISIKPINSYDDAIKYIKIATGSKGALTAEILLDAENTANKIKVSFSKISNALSGFALSDTGTGDSTSTPSGEENKGEESSGETVGYVFGSGKGSVVVVCGTPEKLKYVDYKVKGYDVFSELKDDSSDYGGDSFKCKVFDINIPQKVNGVSWLKSFIPNDKGGPSLLPGAMDPSRIIYYNSFPTKVAEAWMVPSEEKNMETTLIAACLMSMAFSGTMMLLKSGAANGLIGVGGRLLKTVSKLTEGAAEEEATKEAAASIAMEAEEDNRFLNRLLSPIKEKAPGKSILEFLGESLDKEDLVKSFFELNDYTRYSEGIKKEILEFVSNPSEFGISKEDLGKEVEEALKSAVSECFEESGGCTKEEMIDKFKSNLDGIAKENKEEWSEKVNGFLENEKVKKNMDGVYKEYNEFKPMYELFTTKISILDLSRYLRAKILIKSDLIVALKETDEGEFGDVIESLKEASTEEQKQEAFQTLMNKLQKNKNIGEFYSNFVENLKSSAVIGDNEVFYKNFIKTMKASNYRDTLKYLAYITAKNKKSWFFVLNYLSTHHYLDNVANDLGMNPYVADNLANIFGCSLLRGKGLYGSCMVAAFVYTNLWYADLLKVKKLPSQDKNDLYVYSPVLGFLKFPNNPALATKKIPLNSDVYKYSVFLEPKSGGKVISFYLASPCRGDFVVYKPSTPVSLVVYDIKIFPQNCNVLPGNEAKCKEYCGEIMNKLIMGSPDINKIIEKFAENKSCMLYCRREFCKDIISYIYNPVYNDEETIMQYILSMNNNKFSHPYLALYTLAILDTPSIVNSYPCVQYILCKYKDVNKCNFHIYSECAIPFYKALPYSNVLKFLPDEEYTIKYYDISKNKIVTLNIEGGEKNIKQVPKSLVSSCKVDKVPSPDMWQNIEAFFHFVDEFTVSKETNPSAIFIRPASKFLGTSPTYNFCYYGKISFSAQMTTFLSQVGIMVGVAIVDIGAEVLTGGGATVVMGALLEAERCLSGAFFVWATANLESEYYWPNNPDIAKSFLGS